MIDPGDGGAQATSGPGGQAASARVARLAVQLRERELDALLVFAPLNLRYLTNFTGSNGLALLRADPGEGEDGERFFTDFRYTLQSAEQVPQAFARSIVTGSLLDAATRALGEAGGRLGFDDAHTAVAEHERLRKGLAQAWELVPSAGLVEQLRVVKDAGEIERMRAAAQLADRALTEVLEGGLVGRKERDVAIDLELRMRRLGAEAPSFGSIVAAGPHGALPHAVPRAEEIPRDVLVTIDWGAQHEGYCSDCTRTYATGEGISEQAREVYGVVLAAQQAGVAAVQAGPTGRDVDAVARAVIEQAGYGEQFGHGLGHGVGLDVHEAPRLSRVESEQPLRAGNVVTVEPGIYLPDRLGVRIEDLLVVCDGAQETLNGLDKALTVIS